MAYPFGQVDNGEGSERGVLAVSSMQLEAAKVFGTIKVGCFELDMIEYSDNDECVVLLREDDTGRYLLSAELVFASGEYHEVPTGITADVNPDADVMDLSAAARSHYRDYTLFLRYSLE
jgi:hypothetical protein